MATRGWESATPHDTRHRRPLARLPHTGRSKYNAVKTTVDGIVFASKAEAGRYSYLKALERAGVIQGLRLQPIYPIAPTCWDLVGRHVCNYVADFQYYRKDGELVIEDVKGMKTPVYRLKKKLVEAIYGITITEVR
jgi:hypothetical protein